MFSASTVCLSFNDCDHLYWKLYSGQDSKKSLFQGCVCDGESIAKITSNSQELALDEVIHLIIVFLNGVIMGHWCSTADEGVKEEFPWTSNVQEGGNDVIVNASFAIWRTKWSKKDTNNGKNDDLSKYKNENQGNNENSDEKCADYNSIKNCDKTDDQNCTYIGFEIYASSVLPHFLDAQPEGLRVAIITKIEGLHDFFAAAAARSLCKQRLSRV